MADDLKVKVNELINDISLIGLTESQAAKVRLDIENRYAIYAGILAFAVELGIETLDDDSEYWKSPTLRELACKRMKESIHGIVVNPTHEEREKNGKKTEKKSA